MTEQCIRSVVYEGDNLSTVTQIIVTLSDN